MPDTNYFPSPQFQPRTVAADDRVSRMEDALHKIQTWARAYPVNVFPEPDLKRAAEVLALNGISLDAISAHAMRHVLDGLAEIAQAGLGE